ncbi:MAG: hypothetical protein HOO67_06135 [Candidatus Peribacteraceae bacterium]|nr:hypothetical protein [Candidatus Peribacteraceae bacterium]
MLSATKNPKNALAKSQLTNRWRFVDQMEQSTIETVAGKKCSWIQIMRTGEWRHPQYGEFSIQPSDILMFKENFEQNVRGVDIAVDCEHEPEKGAAGWIRQMEARDNGHELWAFVEWTPRGETLVASGEFRYISPEFDFRYKDPETQRIVENVIYGVALTNRPFLKGMESVVLTEEAGMAVFSEGKGMKQGMKFGELLDAMKSREVVDKAVNVLSNAQDLLMTASNLVGDCIYDEALSEADKEKKVLSVLKDLPEAILAILKDVEVVKASEQALSLVNRAEKALKEEGAMETVSLKEHNDLKAEVRKLTDGAVALQAKADQAEAKLKEMEADKSVEAAVRAGKITPAQREWAKGYALKDPTGFASFVKDAPVVVKLSERTTEQGGAGQGSGDEGKSASEQLHAKAKELQAANQGMKFSEALSRAGKENPELYEQYRLKETPRIS